MIYRKMPPQPGRLLLRIVATTGAGTLLGVVACGSPAEHGCMGVCIPVGSSGSAGASSGGSRADTGSEVSGSTESTSGSSGASAGYEYAGSGTTNASGSGTSVSALDAHVPEVGDGSDASPPQAEGGTPDATVMEAG